MNILKKSSLAVVTAVVMATFLFFSCSKDSDNTSSNNPPVGVWEVNGWAIYKIKSNGTFVWYTYDLGSYYSGTGTWTLDNTKTQMTLIDDDGAHVYIVQSMDQNTIVLVNMTTAEVDTFRKKEDKISQIEGKWKCVECQLVDPNIGGPMDPDFGGELTFSASTDVYVDNHIYPWYEVESFYGNQLVLKGDYEIYPKRYFRYTYEKQ